MNICCIIYFYYLYLQGRIIAMSWAQKSSGSFCYRKCYGNPFGFDSAVGAALFCKALLQSDDSSRVHDIHIDNGFLRKDESEQVVTSLQQLGLNLRSCSRRNMAWLC
ncbi:hypothetical protein OUZ56_031179 [Daphnia magna]|uniref:GMP synthase n=1 Tax=Daphnia magna TaxID=35525 RepID=A0ABQ9ZTH9_9CRUS|nr:hypothetical protein OUZ56_031179 [Daphnia magna]